MTWTAEQDGALQAVKRWFKGPYRLKPFYLAGYAGTGKTTLARHFAENITGTVKFAAFTGKAASVLKQKGCPGATTLHSLIYKPVGTSNSKKIKDLEEKIKFELSLGVDIDVVKLAGLRQSLSKIREVSRAMFELREKDDAPGLQGADLVILDECSMIDEQMRKDIESFKVPVLVLGDPGQLPPVKGKGGWMNQSPDYLLQEIHRQAKDSKIIWLANEVRQGRWPGLMEGGDCIVRKKADWLWSHAIDADQVITGKNVTRHKLNQAIRSRKGFNKLYPLIGDKLICLQNDHDAGLLNGVTCTAIADSGKIGQTLDLQISYEGEDKRYFSDPGHFEANYYAKRLSYPAQDLVKHFDYGYAITCHKSQGSQWGTVLICDDKMRANDVEMRKKWLYTAITRAENKLILYT